MKAKFIFILLIPFLFLSCANLKKLAQNQLPKASVAKTRITGISFKGLEITFDIKIDNPNPIGINLAGFDYAIKLNNTRFLNGNLDKKATIKAKGNSLFPVPVAFTFDDLYATYQNLKNAKAANYTLDAGIKVDIPVLGITRIPVQTKGEFPIVRLPKISLNGLKLDQLNLSGADLTLSVDIDNPNTFGFDLNKLTYDFLIAGNSWAKGTTSKLNKVAAGKKQTVAIPVKVNFLEMGRSIYNMISGSQKLDYNINGNLNLSSDYKLLGNQTIDFEKSGKLQLQK
jgi:LEA14-like dessication related protein